MKLKHISLKDFTSLVKDGATPNDLSGSVIRSASPLNIIPKAQGASSRTRSFILSSSSVDRDNDTIDQKGWHLDQFKKNGAVLWSHDAAQPAIAAPSNTHVNDGLLKGSATFPTEDVYEFAALIFRLVNAGIMKNTSVGFIPRSWDINEKRSGGYDFKTQDLLEWSITPVGSNPDTMVEVAKAKDLDLHPMYQWTERALEGDVASYVDHEGTMVLHKALKAQWSNRAADMVTSQALNSATSAITSETPVEPKTKQVEPEGLPDGEEPSVESVVSSLQEIVAAQAEAIAELQSAVLEMADRIASDPVDKAEDEDEDKPVEDEDEDKPADEDAPTEDEDEEDEDEDEEDEEDEDEDEEEVIKSLKEDVLKAFKEVIPDLAKQIQRSRGRLD